MVPDLSLLTLSTGGSQEVAEAARRKQGLPPLDSDSLQVILDSDPCSLNFDGRLVDKNSKNVVEDFLTGDSYWDRVIAMWKRDAPWTGMFEEAPPKECATQVAELCKNTNWTVLSLEHLKRAAAEQVAARWLKIDTTDIKEVDLKNENAKSLKNYIVEVKTRARVPSTESPTFSGKGDRAVVETETYDVNTKDYPDDGDEKWTELIDYASPRLTDVDFNPTMDDPTRRFADAWVQEERPQTSISKQQLITERLNYLKNMCAMIKKRQCLLIIVAVLMDVIKDAGAFHRVHTPRVYYTFPDRHDASRPELINLMELNKAARVAARDAIESLVVLFHEFASTLGSNETQFFDWGKRNTDSFSGGQGDWMQDWLVNDNRHLLIASARQAARAFMTTHSFKEEFLIEAKQVSWEEKWEKQLSKIQELLAAVGDGSFVTLKRNK